MNMTLQVLNDTVGTSLLARSSQNKRPLLLFRRVEANSTSAYESLKKAISPANNPVLLE